MENGETRATFWMDFILEKAEFPAPSRLRSQFADARFFDFCGCGCNTFRVEPRNPEAKPLAGSSEDLPKGAGAAVYEAVFELKDGKTLEIIVFADRYGNLCEVEVDCCSNSYPVPVVIETTGPPFHTRAAEALLPDNVTD